MNRQRKTGSRINRNVARFALVSFLTLVFAGFIVYQLLQTTVIYADQWNAKAAAELNSVDTIPPMRGDILAADGSVLATNINVYDLRIDYQCERFAEERYRAAIDSLADSLATYFHQRDRKGWADYLREPIEKAKDVRPRAFPLLRGVNFTDYERVKNFPFLNIPNKNRSGLTVESRVARIYPYGDMARRSIGRVSENPKTGQIHGLSGLECALDSLLYGAPGVTHKVALTRNVVNWVDRPPRNGYTLRTTIDVNLQDMLEEELEKILLQSRAEWGAAILMETATGDIKAMANLECDTAKMITFEAMNRLVEPVEPGSVLKLVGMIIALEDGLVTNTEATIRQEPYVYYGTSLSDTHYQSQSYPGTTNDLPIERILEFSSNIGISRVLLPHFSQDIPGWHRRVAELGLFEHFNTGIAREQVCEYANPRNGALGTLASQTFGYGARMSPLYTCALYNAVANDGRFVRPRLVSAIRLPDGRDSILPVSYHRDRICSSDNASILRRMLHRVVWERGGTAKQLKSDLVELAGKTGTAKIHVYIDPKLPPAKRDSLMRRYGPLASPKGGYREGKHMRVSFVGFFPFNDPKYTCMVIVNDPANGGAQSTSGMVVKNMAERMLAHGYIGDTPDFRSEACNTHSHAYVYNTTNSERRRTLLSSLDFNSDATGVVDKPSGHGVPDMRGFGLRDAVVTLEECGYNVKFSGVGRVVSQTPEPGTPAAKGSVVTLTLSTE